MSEGQRGPLRDDQAKNATEKSFAKVSKGDTKKVGAGFKPARITASLTVQTTTNQTTIFSSPFCHHETFAKLRHSCESRPFTGRNVHPEGLGKPGSDYQCVGLKRWPGVLQRSLTLDILAHLYHHRGMRQNRRPPASAQNIAASRVSATFRCTYRQLNIGNRSAGRGANRSDVSDLISREIGEIDCSRSHGDGTRPKAYEDSGETQTTSRLRRTL